MNLLAGYPDVLTLKDVCKILRCGRNAGLKLLGTGVIRSFKVGNAYRVLKVNMIEYLTGLQKD